MFYLKHLRKVINQFRVSLIFRKESNLIFFLREFLKEKTDKRSKDQQ